MKEDQDQAKRSKPARSGLTIDLRRRLPPFSWLKSFEAVATCGGVRKVAEAMSTDHATVSCQLRALESWAGVRLFDRSPGTDGAVTPEGEAFYRQIAPALLEIAKASVELTHRFDSPKLKLWCAPRVLCPTGWLAGRLGSYSRAHPEAEIVLNPTEDVPDFSGHQADARIFYHSDNQEALQETASVRRVEIARPPYIAVAAPHYLQSRPPIVAPVDLLSHSLLHEYDGAQWARWLAQHDVSVGHLKGAHAIGKRI